MSATRRAVLSAIASGAVAATFAPAFALAAIDAKNSPPQVIDPYVARFGRARPVVAVVAQNEATELTDFVIPFGVLSASGAADVVAVSTAPGAVRMFPALRLRMQATLGEFDRRYPDGADYVVVPMVLNDGDPVLLDWIKAQAARRGTIVAICNGALAVANTGLMDGRRAVSWWGSEAERLSRFPNVRWEKNIRFVADGRIVSSAGISASLPISLALVEAIAGRDRAAALAAEIGVADWSSRHDSDAFQPRPGAAPLPERSNGDDREIVGVPVTEGIDEIALALTAEPYSSNGRSQAVGYAATGAPVRTRHGLLVVPERFEGGPEPVARVLPPLAAGPSAKALDRALAAVEADYGRAAAAGSARIMEYPGYAT